MAGKKFRFSLESVLTLRRYETERAQQHLGQAVQERRKQEEQVHHMEERLTQLPGTAPGIVDPVVLRRQAAFREDALRRYEAACNELNDRVQREGIAREQLREKHGAQESLHILREKEEMVHKKEQADAEGAFLDDQAISGYLRKKAGTPTTHTGS